MEELISGLLNDFEKGKMTRRQLIQSLALAAAAVAPTGTVLAQGAAAQAPSMIPPPKDPAPWKTVWLDHISFQVTDYRRSTAFYRDLMGWQIIKDDGQRQCTMKIGDIGGIIVRNRFGGRGAANPTAGGAALASAADAPTPGASGQRGQGDRPPVNAVIDHISFGVDPWDTDKVKAELERRGLAPRPDMVGDKFKSFHVKDPDGWDLQISNQTDTSQL
jgi:catechol 2,3-dioxygenase-like lactoylglutathione lyase family enzyme